MKSWAAAGDRIRERRFNDLLNDAERDIGWGYDFTTYRSALPGFVQSILADNAGLAEDVVEFPMKQVLFVSEALTAITKFYHVLACACVSMDHGALTWSTVDAYHASLFGARALLATYGVVPYSLEGRTVLVDLWPEVGRHDYVKSFRKEYGHSTDLIRLMAPSRQLTQGDLWALLKRLSNVADRGDEEQQERLRHLREIIDEKPWQSRHANLYDSASWTWPEDIEFMKASKEEKSARLLTDDRAVATMMELIDLQFEFLGVLADRLKSLTSLAAIQVPLIIQTAKLPTVLCNW